MNYIIIMLWYIPLKAYVLHFSQYMASNNCLFSEKVCGIMPPEKENFIILYNFQLVLKRADALRTIHNEPYLLGPLKRLCLDSKFRVFFFKKKTFYLL